VLYDYPRILDFLNMSFYSEGDIDKKPTNYLDLKMRLVAIKKEYTS